MGGAAAGNNPFNDMPASKTANGSFVGEGSICHNYEVKCFGYLMGIFSLVPHAMYGYGIDRHFRMLSLGDYPFPELQSVGMDAIKNSEIYVPVVNNDSDLGIFLDTAILSTWMTVFMAFCVQVGPFPLLSSNAGLHSFLS